MVSAGKCRSKSCSVVCGVCGAGARAQRRLHVLQVPVTVHGTLGDGVLHSDEWFQVRKKEGGDDSVEV